MVRKHALISLATQELSPHVLYPPRILSTAAEQLHSHVAAGV